MTSGDFWVRKKVSCLWETFSYILCILSFLLFSVLYVFLDIQSSRYIVFLFLSGDIKSIFSFIWKNSLFAVLFSGKLMMIITKKKVSSLSICLLIFCLISSMCTSSHFRSKRWRRRYFPAYVHRIVYLTHQKIWINDSWFTFCGFWINLHNEGKRIKKFSI